MAEQKEVIPAWIKTLYFKFATNFIIKMLARFGLRLAGPLGWIASFFIENILKKGWELIVKLTIWKEEEIETAKELKEYKKTINKEGVNAEAIKEAGKDFLSS